MTTGAFFDRSKEISKGFLHSAVIVDDLARLGDEQAKPLVQPGRGHKGGTDRPNEASATHDLDAKKLIDAFAEVGIVCAALRPKLQASTVPGETSAKEAQEVDNFDELKLRIDGATERADIVIVDWNIPPEPEPGQNACKLIELILSTDNPSGAASDRSSSTRRMRLIAIYTGESETIPIVEKLATLANRLRLPSVTSDGFTVKAGAVTMVVYGKEKGVTEGDAPDRRVTEDELPSRLLDDYTKMASGLLANVALASLSAVRTNTHRIISRFGPQIDAPYVAHRAMMEPPEEASEHPVPLVASEIESILADASQIRGHVGERAIREWLDSLVDVPMGAGLSLEKEPFKSRLVGLLTNGLMGQQPEDEADSEWNELIDDLQNFRSRRSASRLSNELTHTEVVGEDADAEFAMLTSTRSQYDEPTPYLRLGTVIAYKRKRRWKYRLCIQPLCDSVRLKGKRTFPFIRLEPVKSDEDRPFDFVVRDRGELRRLGVSLKAHEMDLLSMSHDKDKGLVLARREDKDWIFPTEESDPKSVRWVGDLKTSFAHRIAHSFAAKISRVGLTESEWLRRMNRRYPPLAE